MPGTYTTNAAVASFLGLTLTSAQQSEADTLIAAATAYIDRETRRGWQVPAITGEQYRLISSTVYLRSHPVTSIQQVRTRTTAVGDTFYTAVPGVDYELFDPNLGMLRFSSGYSGPSSYAFVDYTPALGTVPADIALCATLIVANNLTSAILPDNFGLSKVQFGRETALTFQQNGVQIVVPSMAQQIIDGYRLPIF